MNLLHMDAQIHLEMINYSGMDFSFAKMDFTLTEGRESTKPTGLRLI